MTIERSDYSSTTVDTDFDPDVTMPRASLPTRRREESLETTIRREELRRTREDLPRRRVGQTPATPAPRRVSDAVAATTPSSLPNTGTSKTAPRGASRALEARRLWERKYANRLRVTDISIILAATLVPKTIQLATMPGIEGASPFAIAQAYTVPVLVAIAWSLGLVACRTRETQILGSGATEYLRVFHATGLAFGGLAALFVVFRTDGLRSQLLISLPIGIVLLMFGRWAWRRWLLHERAFGHYVSRALIVGDRADVEYVIETLHRDSQRTYFVVGAAVNDHDGSDLMVDGRPYPAVGSPRTAARTAKKLSADTVVVASHDDADPYFVKRLSWQLEGTAAELVLSSRLTDVAGPRISLLPVDGLPLIQVKIPTFDGGQYVLKRTMDILISSIALLFIGILAIPLGILIKLDSRGPIFFRQERVGRDGHRFRMVKFRTMGVDAEARLADLVQDNEGAGPLFKMQNDPRVTRVGAVLRKLSLDELPQFWNVLRGDMSVVGPRPPLPSEVTAYNGAVYRRLYIKPGITGLWQVSGRSDLPWDESVRLDLRYVENWSLLSDLILIWRTVRVMVSRDGAY